MTVHEPTRDAKRREVARLLREHAASGSSTLSPQQQRLWFLEQLTPGSAASTVAAARLLRGRLEAARLRRAVGAAVAAHDALRSVFLAVDARPVRIVLPSLPVVVATVEPEGARSDRGRELTRIVRELARRPFDLARGPLVRFALVPFDDDELVIASVAHRIACDERALQRLLDELLDRYGGADGVGVASPREASLSGGREGGDDGRLDWWRARLDGLEPLQLPGDRPRPRVQTFDGWTRRRTLPAGLARALEAVATRSGATLEAALLAAFALALARSGGQRDLGVGVLREAWPPAGDPIGPHATTLVVRCSLGDDPTFAEAVAGVARALADAEAHMLPFERLVDELQPARDLSRGPLVQAGFALASTPPAARELGGLTVEPLELDLAVARLDVELGAAIAADGVRLALDGNAAIFDERTGDRLLERVEALAAAGAAAPDRPIGALEALPERERAELGRWSLGPARAQPAGTVVDLIAEPIARTPNATAVVAGDRRLTFAELDERANRLAHRLRAVGVRRESRVAVCLPRSADLLVALVAVLRAGAAYVPLTPSYPRERLELMLGDCGAAALVTAGGALAADAVPTIDVERDAPAIAACAAESPAVAIDPADLAYVIYTSGSTGRPKGVAVSHGAVVNYLAWAIDAYDVAGGSGVPVHSPVGFDLTVTSLFAPLASGRPAIVLPEGELVAPLTDCLRARRDLSFVKLTPAHLELLAHALRDADAERATRCLVLGGEALDGDAVAAWRERAPATRVVNEYGPTEATVGCCVYEVGAGAPVAPGPVPIGRPIANTVLRVLDEGMRPVPIGAHGELYVGGAGLARGYLGRPDLTAERFVPDPYGAPGARLYRTGDVVRYRADGELEFLGRADDQVKLRGHRVELGEVEAALRAHHAVRDVAVAMREDVPGDRRLVAYVVAAGEPPPPAELRSFAERSLPEYMVPSAIDTLDALPLSPNGKVDRRALPAPEADRSQLASAYVAPRTPLEQELAETFASVLGVERVGVEDDFFELGGHSLLVARVFARLVGSHDVDLPLESFFHVPTVAGMARVIEIYRREGRDAALAALEDVDLQAEAVLDAAITPAGLPRAAVLDPSQIFVTGATGFLGSFLVGELLARTRAQIVCLVRADDDAVAARRLRAAVEARTGWSEDHELRVRAVRGDLAEPLLGLGEERFAELAGSIDTIYHSGALVNFVFPYSALRAANVQGTEEVLRLATTTRAKAVHHFSAVDVFVSGEQGDEEMSEDALPAREPAAHGYVQTKWVSERLVVAARERGLPTCVYRPWIVMGHSGTGVGHLSDLMYLVLKGCITLEQAPAIDLTVNVVPVDYVAAAVAYLSLQEDSFGRTFHFANPHPAHVSAMYDVIRSVGYRLDEVSWAEWRARATEVGPDHALYSVAPLFRPEALYPEELNPRIDATNTLRGLDGSGIACPPLDERLMRTYLARLIDDEWIPAPAHARAAAG